MRLAFALFAAVVPLAAGCTANARATSDPPVVVNPGSTLAFAPSTIDVWRTAGACGVSNPPYSPADIYNLDAIGAQASGPLTALSVTVENGSVTIGTPYDLALDAPIASTNPGGDSRAQNGASSDHVVSFQFQWGAAHPGEIDPSTLDAVTATFLAFPSHDGDPLTVHYVLHFADQQTLDVTLSGDMTSDLVGCGAG